MSVVNSNFDNLLDTSQVLKGMSMIQSGMIKKVMEKCWFPSVMSLTDRITNLSNTVIIINST